MKKTRVPALLISCVVLLASVLAIWATSSNWGTVKISSDTMMAGNGGRYRYISYVQKSASKENPSPAVVVFHGSNDNAQGFSGWCIELARRGYSVFALDKDATGFSDRIGTNRYELVLDFTNMIKALPFVDPERVITSGHSMGGMESMYLMQETDLAGAIVVSSIIGSDDKDIHLIRGNQAYILGVGDVLNQTHDPSRSLETAQQFYQLAFGSGEEPVDGQAYGSVEENNYRKMTYYDGLLSFHAAARYSPTVIAYLCENAELFVPTGTTLQPGDQVYQWSYLASLVAMFALMAVAVSLFLTLMRMPFFAEIRRPLPALIAHTGSAWFVSAAISMIPSIPLFMLVCWFVTNHTDLIQGNAVLPVGNMNRFIFFFVFLGVYEIVLFYFNFYRRRKLTLEQCGLAWAGTRKDNLRIGAKALLLGAVAAGTALTVLYLLDEGFGLSLTTYWMNLRAIQLDRVGLTIPYVILFAVLFIGMQFGGNITRRLPSTGHENRDMLRDIVVNTLVSGLLITLMFAYNVVCMSQQVFGLLDDVRAYYLFGYTIIVPLAQTINTVLYRKTGTIWPGVMLSTILLGVLIPTGYPVKYF